MASDLSRFRTITEALGAAPGDRPFITAWIDEDEQEDITFGEFRSWAGRYASMLQNEGVLPGDRVVIIMPQSIPAMATFAGAMMLGAVPAFLAYPNFKIEPAKYRSGLLGVTANLSAKLVVIDEGFPSELLGHVATGDSTKLVRIGKSAPGTSENDIFEPNEPETIAFLQHSAGTTGLQKGVALTHVAALKQIGYLAEALQIDNKADRVYSWLPLYHDMGLIACFMLPLVCHIPVVMQSPLDWVMHPETMLQVITDYKCTLAWMPNFGLQFLPRRVKVDRGNSYDLSSLRALINCSEPVRATSMEEFRRTFAASGLRPNALHSSYAMAEDVFAITQSHLQSGRGPRCICADGASFRSEGVIHIVPKNCEGSISFISSGRLLPNHKVHILAESGSEAEDGRVGEILIKSDCLFQGYYNRPDLTEEAFRDGWYRTGDLGFLLDDDLFVVGRKKDLLIIGGENLYPQDIEEIVSQHPAVHDGRAVAFGIYNPALGTEEITIAAEVENEDLLSTPAQIESEIRSRVVSALGVAPRYILLKPPRWIIKSTAGKPARSTTREKLLREHPELNYENEGVRI
jgi:acyl-CoA synthetase (AMP-forming)/AMP-acid ligase II